MSGGYFHPCWTASWKEMITDTLHGQNPCPFVKRELEFSEYPEKVWFRFFPWKGRGDFKKGEYHFLMVFFNCSTTTDFHLAIRDSFVTHFYAFTKHFLLNTLKFAIFKKIYFVKISLTLINVFHLCLKATVLDITIIFIWPCTSTNIFLLEIPPKWWSLVASIETE